MEEKLKRAALRLQEVELLLSQPEVYADPARLRDLTREQKELEPVVIAFRELEAARIMQREAEGMLADPELRDLAREELLEARERQNRLTQELKLLLLPKDPDDGRSVILELRAGVGGEEGALWGPSIMPGGTPASYDRLGPMFEAIAGTYDGVPCCTYIGPNICRVGRCGVPRDRTAANTGGAGAAAGRITAPSHLWRAAERSDGASGGGVRYPFGMSAYPVVDAG